MKYSHLRKIDTNLSHILGDEYPEYLKEPIDDELKVSSKLFLLGDHEYPIFSKKMLYLSYFHLLNKENNEAKEAVKSLLLVQGVSPNELHQLDAIHESISDTGEKQLSTQTLRLYLTAIDGDKDYMINSQQDVIDTCKKLNTLELYRELSPKTWKVLMLRVKCNYENLGVQDTVTENYIKKASKVKTMNFLDFEKEISYRMQKLKDPSVYEKILSFSDFHTLDNGLLMDFLELLYSLDKISGVTNLYGKTMKTLYNVVFSGESVEDVEKRLGMLLKHGESFIPVQLLLDIPRDELMLRLTNDTILKVLSVMDNVGNPILMDNAWNSIDEDLKRDIVKLLIEFGNDSY